MTWDDHHRRDEALRTVITLADRRRDGLLPFDEVPDAAAAFGTTADLLRALQMRWHTRLAGAVDQMLGSEPEDIAATVACAWRYTAADLAGVRAILDANLDHPALVAGRRKDHLLLASALGLAGVEDPRAVRAGAELEARARTITIETSLSRASHDAHRIGMRDRLRHAFT